MQPPDLRMSTFIMVCHPSAALHPVTVRSYCAIKFCVSSVGSTTAGANPTVPQSCRAILSLQVLVLCSCITGPVHSLSGAGDGNNSGLRKPDVVELHAGPQTGKFSCFVCTALLRQALPTTSEPAFCLMPLLYFLKSLPKVGSLRVGPSRSHAMQRRAPVLTMRL